MIRTSLQAFVLMVCVARAGYAQASPSGGLTLDEGVRIALARNSDLQIARAATDSARGQRSTARAIPNPTLVSIPGSPSQFGLTFPLDVGPQRLARVRAADRGVAAAIADRDDATRQIVLDVQRAFYDVLLADEVRAIVRARRDVVSQVARTDSERVRAGDLAERVLVRGEVEVVRADADLARAGLDAQRARLALGALLGETAPDTARVIDGTLDYEPVALPDTSELAAALARRPDVIAAETRVAQSRDLVSLARASLVPVPELSLLRQTGQPFPSGRSYAVGVGLELPLLNLYAGERKRAAAGERASEIAAARTRSSAARDAVAAIAAAQVQRALVERYEHGLTERMQANLDASRYAYEHGATSLLEVLDALRAFQDALSDHATALHDYWLSVRTLEAALGRPLSH